MSRVPGDNNSADFICDKKKKRMIAKNIDQEDEFGKRDLLIQIRERLQLLALKIIEENHSA
jgi:hypothetical protein